MVGKGYAPQRYTDEDEMDRAQMIEAEPSQLVEPAYRLSHSHPFDPEVMMEAPPPSPPRVNLALKPFKKIAKKPSIASKVSAASAPAKRKRESSTASSLAKAKRQAKASVPRRKNTKATKRSKTLVCENLDALDDVQQTSTPDNEVVLDFQASPKAAGTLYKRSINDLELSDAPQSFTSHPQLLPKALGKRQSSDHGTSEAAAYRTAREHDWSAKQSLFAQSSLTDKVSFNGSSMAKTALPKSTPSNSGVKRQEIIGKFVTYFKEHFENNSAVLDSAAALCRAFAKNALVEADFYVGLYRLVSDAGSPDVVASFKGVLPGPWKYLNLDLFSQEIEQDIQSKATAGHGNDTPIKKKTKKVPIKGFRAGDMETPTNEANTNSEAYDTASKADTPVSADDMRANPSLIVKLKISDLDEKLKRKKEKEVRTKTDKLSPSVEPQKRNPIASARKSRTSDESSTKIPKSHYHLSLGSEVPHVGDVYSTRRAVLARADRPYICHLCGTGFMHPQDVSNHFGGENTSKTSGCWARNGKPKGDAASWDRHGSCRVGYQDIEYVKVLDGYVILDQESWNRIEDACEAGRRFKRENVGMSDAEGETDDEQLGVGKAVPSQAKKAVPQRKVVRAGGDEL